MVVRASPEFSNLIPLTSKAALAEGIGTDQVYENIAALKAGPKPTATGTSAFVQGYANRSDSKAEKLWWDASDRSADVDGAMIIARDGSNGSDGAWVRDWDGVNLSTTWFGVTVDDESAASANDDAFAALVTYTQNADKILTVNFPQGTIYISNPITIDKHHGVIFDGGNATTIQLSDAAMGTTDVSTKDGPCIFRIEAEINSSSSGTEHIFRNLKLTAQKSGVSTNARTSCIKLDGDGSTHPINFSRLIIEGCRMSATSWCLYFNELQYSVAPIIRNCRFGVGAMMYMTPSTAAVNHATSGLSIRDCRFQGNPIYGPALYLEGHTSTILENIIIEGSLTADWNPETTAEGLVVTLVNGGPVSTEIKNLWSEFFDHSTKTNTYDYWFQSSNTGNRSPATLTIEDSKIESKKIKAIGPSSGHSFEIAFRNCFNAPIPTALDIEDNARVKVFDSLIGDDNDNLATYRNQKHRYIRCRNENDHPISSPSSVIYDYTGGWVSNRYAATKTQSSSQSGTFRFCQQDPYEGPTIIVLRGDLQQSFREDLAFDKFLNKDLLGYARFRLPYYSWADTPGNAFNVAANWVALSSNTQDVIDAYGTDADDGWIEVARRGVESSASPSYGTPTRSGTQTWSWYQYSRMTIIDGEDINVIPPKATTMECFIDPWWGYPIGTFLRGDYFYADRLVSPSGTDATSGLSPTILDPTANHKAVCITEGTSRTINLTGDISSGTNTLSNLSKTGTWDGLFPGDFITITGVSGIKRVLSIDWLDGGTLNATLDSNANATVTGAAIANSSPVWSLH